MPATKRPQAITEILDRLSEIEGELESIRRRSGTSRAAHLLKPLLHERRGLNEKLAAIPPAAAPATAEDDEIDLIDDIADELSDSDEG